MISQFWTLYYNFLFSCFQVYICLYMKFLGGGVIRLEKWFILLIFFCIFDRG